MPEPFMILSRKLIFVFFTIGFSLIPLFVRAENVINLEGPDLLPKTELFITPRSGNFLVGSTFEVPVYLDTKGHNINAVSLKIHFDPTKLSITKPSSGKSIFGIWIETPSYDNTKGTASLVGVIPGGIVTSSGLIGIITFKAIAPGQTTVTITDYTSANLNDGFGSDAKLTLSGATYILSPKPPEGMKISSETHPSEDRWYNNNSPILNWSGQDYNDGYSITFDNSPNTIPANEINSTESSKSYENVQDGVWYFHVKANKKGAWGNTSHFQVKIDTNIPALFSPTANVIENSGKNKKYLLSFLTTDSLSSINHYEVGIINKEDNETISPVFVETESPYLIPLDTSNNIKVLIRAYDNAGNIREASVDLYPGYNVISIIKKYAIYILFGFIILMFLELLIHYLFGHHILSNVGKAYRYFEKMSTKEQIDREDNGNIPLPPINIIERNEKIQKISTINNVNETLKNETIIPKTEEKLTPEIKEEKTEEIIKPEVTEITPIEQSKSENNIVVELKENTQPVIPEDEKYKSIMEKFINPKLIPVDVKNDPKKII